MGGFRLSAAGLRLAGLGANSIPSLVWLAGDARFYGLPAFCEGTWDVSLRRKNS